MMWMMQRLQVVGRDLHESLGYGVGSFTFPWRGTVIPTLFY